ncbi:ABC transporter permease [Ornithinibacillus massiliensis]|uniref:ABC transporter permease n=1 Tax=Ornithinibacillus massiliensis TaxID=1944633 RepID=A0ABS5MG88_9BACI|nr:ABC transporter permease [Ornithinibacillus massiliensis]MBS3681354.1 ABC transporter permease [Ornithinibacillus massiliensis]
MTSTTFRKSGRIARFILRRDRVRLPLWFIGIVFFTLLIPAAFTDLYPSQAERDMMAETMKNPAMVAMVGSADFENYTIGVMTAHQMLIFTAIVVGLMSILLVSRHTRADEEDGRVELIRSLPVGRLSQLNATMMVYVVINIILALCVGFGLYALNIASIDLEGSLLYGAVLGATGIFFTGLTAVFAQISEGSRGTIGLSIAVLIIAYLIRAIGDVSNEVLSWLSPLGWVTQADVYSSNNWLPVLIMLGISIILIVIANYLNAIRDMGAGFLPSKPGRKEASVFLQSPLGLGLRLQRTGLIAWAIGMFVMGASYGSVLGDLEAFFAGSEEMQNMLVAAEGYTLTEQFIPMLMMVMAILATVPAVMSMNKLYGEEKKQRIDHVLSRAVSRTKLMASYLIISIVNGFVMLSLAGIGLWIAGDAVVEGGLDFGTIYGAAIVYYPAILVMISVAVFLIGWLPRRTSLIWLYVFYSFFVLYLGNLFQFSEWVGKLSPFGYIPQLPIEEMDWVSSILLIVIAVGIMIIGFIGYRKRDIQG